MPGLRRVVHLHELGPVDSLEGGSHRERLGRDPLRGVGPHPHGEEQVEGDRHRGEEGIDPPVPKADVVLDPRSLSVREERAQFVDLPAEPVDLPADRQRPDGERDRRSPAHGIQDRKKHARPRPPGQLAHDEDRVVVPVKLEEARPLTASPRRECLNVASHAVRPDRTAFVKGSRRLLHAPREQPRQAWVQELPKVQRVGSAVHRRPPAERMDHRQHSQLGIEPGGRLAKVRLARGDRAHVRGGQTPAFPAEVYMDPLPPEAALGKPLLVERAPDGAGPLAPARPGLLAPGIRVQRGLEVILDRPVDLQRGRFPDDTQEVRVLPAQVEDRAVVGASQVRHLDPGATGEAGAGVEVRPPPEHVPLEPTDRKGPCHLVRLSISLANRRPHGMAQIGRAPRPGCARRID